MTTPDEQPPRPAMTDDARQADFERRVVTDYGALPPGCLEEIMRRMDEAEVATSVGECVAAANLKGEHIPCDGGSDHSGWAHSNREHGLIWVGNEGPSRAVEEPCS